MQFNPSREAMSSAGWRERSWADDVDELSLCLESTLSDSWDSQCLGASGSRPERRAEQSRRFMSKILRKSSAKTHASVGKPAGGDTYTGRGFRNSVRFRSRGAQRATDDAIDDGPADSINSWQGALAPQRRDTLAVLSSASFNDVSAPPSRSSSDNLAYPRAFEVATTSRGSSEEVSIIASDGNPPPRKAALAGVVPSSNIWSRIVAAQSPTGFFELDETVRRAVYQHFCENTENILRDAIENIPSISESFSKSAAHHAHIADTVVVVTYVKTHLAEKIGLWRLMVKKAIDSLHSSVKSVNVADNLLAIALQACGHHHHVTRKQTRGTNPTDETAKAACGVCGPADRNQSLQLTCAEADCGHTFQQWHGLWSHVYETGHMVCDLGDEVVDAQSPTVKSSTSKGLDKRFSQGKSSQNAESANGGGNGKDGSVEKDTAAIVKKDKTERRGGILRRFFSIKKR
jgi:hypothetical protein